MRLPPLAVISSADLRRSSRGSETEEEEKVEEFLLK